MSSSSLSAKVDSDSTDIISKSDSSDVDDNSPSNATSSTVSLNSSTSDDNNLEVKSSSSYNSAQTNDDTDSGDSDFENLVRIANRVLENKSVYVRGLLKLKRKPKNHSNTTTKLSKLAKTMIVSNILNEIKMSGQISETPFISRGRQARRLQLSESQSMELEENCKTCGKSLQVNVDSEKVPLKSSKASNDEPPETIREQTNNQAKSSKKQEEIDQEPVKNEPPRTRSILKKRTIEISNSSSVSSNLLVDDSKSSLNSDQRKKFKTPLQLAANESSKTLKSEKIGKQKPKEIRTSKRNAMEIKNSRKEEEGSSVLSKSDLQSKLTGGEQFNNETITTGLKLVENREEKIFHPRRSLRLKNVSQVLESRKSLKAEN
ncbi:dentin sialophosphoprotein-like [Leptopilina heterotoma]|uniref:dentin sialophosphoprotein-like n=1 Tax=Leptopilina heterotoma TaxID=63436 RepID=UPI001CA8DDB0|nr:dentin sialophosphoprotein-like [Leptopilina heterotoma]